MKKTNKYEQLGNLLLELRLNLGIKQQSELATMLNVTQQTVSRWEKGSSRPEKKQIKLIADVLKTDSKALFVAAGYNTKTPVISFDLPFPFEALTPESFERFSSYFLGYLYPEAEIHRAGSSGHTQYGVDIEVIFNKNKKYTFQCKRQEDFGAAKVHAAIKAHKKKANRKYILLSKVVSPKARGAITKYENWDIWDQDDISRIIRQKLARIEQIKLVDIFFPDMRMQLLGEPDSGPWQTPEEFFDAYMDSSMLFNHAWNLLGRENEISDAVNRLLSNDKKAVFLIGAGGVGKTRILKQIVENYIEVNKAAKVYFLSPTEDVTHKDLENLGKEQKILVIDDAHDRQDLLKILKYAAIKENNTMVLLAFRPYGIDSIKSLSTLASVTADEITINPLSLEQATDLARQVLKSCGGSEDFAEKIANLTIDCTLATVIGAQIVAKEGSHFEFVKNKESFRKEILSRFEKVIAGNIGNKNDECLIHKVLKVIALIQPFYIDDAGVLKLIEQVESVSAPDSNRILNLLTKSGVLFKRGGKYRLSPDLLADSIIEKYCIGHNNKSTGYGEKLFEYATPEQLENILLNLGKLDWRMANGKPEGKLLEDIWKKLRPIHDYCDPHTKAVIAVAFFQPLKALEFAENLIVEKQFLKDIPSLMKNIAYNLEYLPRACEILWELGKNEDRELNPYPEHPIRILSELCAVERDKPVIYNEIAVNFALPLLDKEDSYNCRYTPFDFLKGILKTEGNSTTSDGKSITFIPFLVDLKAVAKIREKLIDKSISLLSNPNIKIGILAANFLGHSIIYPRGLIGMTVQEANRAEWTTEFIQTLNKISAVIKKGELDVLIKIEIAQSISYHVNFNDETADIAQEILSSLSDSEEFALISALIDGWAHYIQRKSLDFNEIEKARNERLNLTKDSLFQKYPVAEDLRDYIEKTLIHISKNHKSTRNTSPQVLYGHLIQNSYEFALATAENAMKYPDSKTAQFAGMALSKILRDNRDLGIEIANKFFESDNIKLRCAIGDAYSLLYEANLKQGDIETLHKVLTSNQPQVVLSAVHAINFIAQREKQIALNLLKLVDIAQGNKIADEVFHYFNGEIWIPFGSLTEKDVKHFLDKLKFMKTLDGYWIEVFLSKASYSHAHVVADFFMERLEYCSKTEDYGFRPCNFGPYSQIALRFRDSSDFSSILKRVSNWLKFRKNDSNHQFQYYSGQLFQAMFGPVDENLISFFQSWLDTAESSDIDIISQILSESNPDFVFKHKTFVINFLEKANQFSKGCLEKAVDALYRASISGVRSGTPGEPFIRDLETKEKCERILKQLSRLSPAYRLYDILKKNAEKSIERSLKERESFEDVA